MEEIEFGESELSRYKKIEKVGFGTYGVVYKYLDNLSNSIVALKRMLLEVYLNIIHSALMNYFNIKGRIRRYSIYCN